MGWADKYAKVTTSRGEEMPPLAPQQAYDRGVGFNTSDMTQIQSENPDPAGVIDAARFSVIEDPKVRIQKFAESRFPDEAPDVREGRYRVVDDDVVYRGPDGKVYREISGPAATFADFAGKSTLPIVGAILGTMMAGPLGAAAGGMGGLGWTKVSGLAQGDEQDSDENAKDILLQGAVDAAVPAAGGKVVEMVANRRAARDVINFDKQATQRLMQTARKHGVTLTPGEASNLGSLINQQTRYGRGMDEAGDVMREFYGERAGAISRAVDDFLGATPNAETAGAAARDVARQSIDDARTAVSIGSRSAYKATVSKDNLVPERAFMELDADPVINEYINKVKETPLYGLMDAPRNSTAVIDAAGKLMREEADNFAEGSFSQKALSGKRSQLLNFMEGTYPEYKRARTAQRTMRETHLDPLVDGVEGVVARLKDTSLASIPDKLISAKNVSPASVARWRQEFVSQGKEKEWDQLVNAYLRNVWEGKAQTGRTLQDLTGPRFREMVFGTTGKQKVMREALGPKRFQAFKDLMDVLEAVGRVPRGQSMTQPAAEAAKAEARDSAPVVAFARELDATRPLEALGNWWVENKTGNWRESLAKAITSPDAVKELEKLKVLRRLSPGSKRKAEVVLQALTKAGVIGSSYPRSPEATHQQLPPPPQ